MKIMTGLMLDDGDKEAIQLLCVRERTNLSQVTRLLHKALLKGLITMEQLKRLK